MALNTRPARPARPADPTVTYRRLLAARVSEAAASAHAPPSPCISVCQMDSQTDLCIGCLRTIPEIGAWANSTDTDKRAVWRLIGQRLESFP